MPVSEFLIAPYDIETNGLLEPKRDKNQQVTEPAMDRVHGVCFALMDGKFNVLRWISAADAPGYEMGTFHYTLPGRVDEEGFPVRTVFEPLGFTPPAEATVWERMPIVDALLLLGTADIRVAHNGQDFDERAIKMVYPALWPPKQGKLLDTLLLSRVTYPDIHRTGPNKHKLFSFEQRQHGVSAWGKRLGVHKGEYTDWAKKKGIDPWANWSEQMQAYNEDDVVVLIAILKWLWAQKTDQRAVDLEHEFGSIIRRQERHGWAFDKDEAEELLTELQIKEAHLELGLIGQFGSWWAPVRRGKAGSEDDLKAAWKDQDEDEDEEDDAEQAKRKAKFAGAFAHMVQQAKNYQVIPTMDRAVKMVGYPDITVRQFSEKTGKELKPYVGPPKQHYTQGHPYTPIQRVEFNPGSRTHIWMRLMLKYGWDPVKFTPGGPKVPPAPMVDEDVLSGLPYPEAKQLAEYFLVLKRLGMLATGRKAWLKYARETEHANGQSTYRVHGRMNTNGAATGRSTHSDPNMGQVPANHAAEENYPNSPELHGIRCRSLFVASPGMILAGFDGSSLELRMLAHYISPWDGGAYARIVNEGKSSEGTDPHSWLRDLIGVDIMGEGDIGRNKAKTLMYACVPMETQALTRRGWKLPGELILGEDILTYNPEKGVKEWQPLLEVVTYADAPLIRMHHGHSFDVTSTPNHRWFTRRRTGRKVHYMVDEVATTEQIGTEHSIIVNAPMGCDQDVDTGGRDWVLDHDKYHLTAWDRAVLRMSQPEREAFLGGFLIADGHHNGRNWQWSQNEGPLAEAAMLATYLVLPGKVHVGRKLSPNRSNPLNHILSVTSGVKSHTTGSKLVKESVPNAPVWCPRTENGSWVMRQGNVITITGNTLYGAGQLKQGSIVMPTGEERERIALGREIQALMAERFDAKTKLQLEIEKRVEDKGTLKGLDGRTLFIRKPHAALNSLLQSAGAVVMKKSLVVLDKGLQTAGLIPGRDYEYVGNIHDEVQADLLPTRKDVYTEEALSALPKAGAFFNLRCPLAAEVKFGHSWADTH